MNIMEISLLILGIGIFVASFIVPELLGKNGDSIEVSDELIQKMIDRQMDETKKKLEGVVDETLEYAVEKTERAAERISNEKIMAVNEYSDTVLEEINKNHKEVMFLYDMLNDKHKNITSAAIEVDKKAKVAEATAKEAEEKVLEAKKQAEIVKEQVKAEPREEKKSVVVQTAPVESQKEESKQSAEKPLSAIDILRSKQRQAADNMIEVLGAKRIERPANMPKKVETVSGIMEEVKKEKAMPAQKTAEPAQSTKAQEQFQTLDVKHVTGQEHILEQYVSAAKEQNKELEKEKEPAAETLQGNNNDKILMLHKEGKSNVAIAKELGLGVGEVSLVLNLYKGA